MGETASIDTQNLMETQMFDRLKDMHRMHRDRRDARRVFRATRHLGAHLLDDIGVEHRDGRAYRL